MVVSRKPAWSRLYRESAARPIDVAEDARAAIPSPKNILSLKCLDWKAQSATLSVRHSPTWRALTLRRRRPAQTACFVVECVEHRTGRAGDRGLQACNH